MKLKGILLGLALLSTQNYAAEAIGFYSNGSLKNGISIMDGNYKIHKLLQGRKKFFSTLELQETIGDASDYIQSVFPDAEPLQLGDLSAQHGGKAPGHSSHQNGLDVDIVYLTHNKKLQSTNATYWEEDFVKNKKVTANFHVERNFELFKFLVMEKNVQRIFVDQAIKKTMCNYAKVNNIAKEKSVIETLRRLRVADLHSTHLHVRIRCSANDLKCTEQAEVPAGPGC